MSAQRLKLVWAHQAILPPFSRLDFQHFPTEQFSCKVQNSLKERSIFHLRWSTDLPRCLHLFFFYFFSLAPCMCWQRGVVVVWKSQMSHPSTEQQTVLGFFPQHCQQKDPLYLLCWNPREGYTPWLPAFTPWLAGFSAAHFCNSAV